MRVLGSRRIALTLAAAAFVSVAAGCTEPAGASEPGDIAAAAATEGQSSGTAGPLQPAFNQTPCDIPGVTPEIRPRLRCGTVSVPRDYRAPGAGQFRLAVVVVVSPRQPALPDPVVYINGGPGAPLTAYAAAQARTPYAPGRDLVLIDQRGTGRSEPGLCPDLNDDLLGANIAVASAVGPAETEAALARRRAIHASCRDTAIAHGFDLKDFGTTVTVADFEWVRRALAIERWNVHGESYGTTVAMTLASLHPASIRSLVLDSVYAPDPGPLWSARVADALDAFFGNCDSDPVCSRSFPKLAAIYRDTLDRLDRDPLDVTVPQRPGDRLRLTAAMFEDLVGNLLYYPTYYCGLPRLIREVHDRDTHNLDAVLAAAYASASSLNRATHDAVECRDRPYYHAPLPPDAKALDVMSLYGVCDGWSEPGPPPLVPDGTNVPTLVLSGQFDPNARPDFSRQLATRIGDHARWIGFPGLGHNVRGFSPCAVAIVAAFMDDPTRALDTSCVERRPPIAFVH